MAGLRKFQLLHGGVLTQLLKGKNKITLTMIETHREEWATYRVSLERSDDEQWLIIQHRTRKAPRGGKTKATPWTFTFSEGQLRRIHKGLKKEGCKVHVALICVHGTIDKALRGFSSGIPACLIENDKLKKIIDEGIKTITIKYEPGKQFSVLANRKELFKVPQSALEKLSSGS